MPKDGDIGTANDGTAVVWVEKLQRAYPISYAKQMGYKVNEEGDRSPAAVEQAKSYDPNDPAYGTLSPGSETRGRLALGLGPALEGVRNLDRLELPKGAAQRSNPLNKRWLASGMESLNTGKLAEVGPFKGIITAMAKGAGGGEYQQYEQAAKSFEAAMLPILSGAAVTDSEAARQIKAALNVLGDSDPRTLAQKAKQRKMMLNGGADLAGRPRPYPEVGTWDFAGGKESDQLILPKAYYDAHPEARGMAPGRTAAVDPTTGQQRKLVPNAPVRGLPQAGRVRVTDQSGQVIDKPADWGNQLTPAQRATAARSRGSKAPSGSAQNPWLPTTQEEYDDLPASTAARPSYYIAPDGSVVAKR